MKTNQIERVRATAVGELGTLSVGLSFRCAFNLGSSEDAVVHAVGLVASFDGEAARGRGEKKTRRLSGMGALMAARC